MNKDNTTTISIRGHEVIVPCARIAEREVIVTGRWPRIALLRDEEWQVSAESLKPLEFASLIRVSPLRADVFTCSGELDAPVLENVAHDLDNVAVIATTDFKEWWEGLPQEARKNTRRAAKRGVVIRTVHLDGDLAKAIKAIYDETPVRQGRNFWHYGKDVDTILRENSTYLDRSEFLGAYHEGALIGFMKLVYVKDIARIMQILCLNAHQDKRPMIALIARGAEICHERGMRYLVYGKYTYGNKGDSSITEFKRRLGLQKKEFPRYIIPLTSSGRLAVALGIHAGWKELLPAALLNVLLDARASWLRRRVRPAAAGASES